MKKAVLAACFMFWLVMTAQAQPGRYLIQLKNKGQNPFSLTNPAQFLSARSLERRTRYNIALDSTDLPVSPAYLDSLRGLSNVIVLNASKWLNQVSIQTSDSAALEAIRHFPFVQSARRIASRMVRSSQPEDQISKLDKAGIQSVSNTEQVYDYGAATAQVSLHNGAFLHNIGLRGQGMILSLLDAGFYHYTSLSAFDSVRTNGQILGTWDFVAREASVAEDHQHGMYCFSTIAANIPGKFMGTAPKASFYLFRSEDAASEYPIEEHNWVCAAERVDSAGGDVISSSLGYNNFNDPALNHLYNEMDGHTTMAARGASLAAAKGILVVNAAGNEGSSAWKYILTPADADSVLVVGAVDTLGQVAPFSSYGPSADGQIKPDVVSVGVNTLIQGTGNTLVRGSGTSFACPNMAGLVTCFWQGFPEFTNMHVIDALRRSGSMAETPDNRMGYGIPDMKKAVQLLLQDFATTGVSSCNTIQWTSKDMSSMRYDIERQRPGEAAFTKIGEQSGTGPVFQTHTFQFTDGELTAASGLVRYRIRQVLDTATATFTAFYLDTVSIAVALTCTPVPASENGIQIIPNPVQQAFYVKIDNGAAIADLQLAVVNALGQTLSVTHTSKPGSMSVFRIDATGLARGLYFLVVYDAGERLVTKKFIKL